MDYQNIGLAVYSTLKNCNITSFPLDCFSIMQTFGYNIISYDNLSAKKSDACRKLSEDACIIENTLYYNNNCSNKRMRFSFMHELGHIILNDDRETTANKFASYILSPRIAIHYAKCKNAYDVSKAFEISYEAAKIAFEDYLRWRHYIVLRNNKITPIDKAMYDHFYNSEYGKFVWAMRECKHCGRTIINSADDTCEYCNIELWGLPEPLDCPCESAPVEPEATNWWEPPGFDEAEQQWLYGNDL